MSYPDREKVMGWLNAVSTNPNWWDAYYSPSETKACAEAALAMLKEQEAKHGKWLESKILEDCFWVCSECEFPSEAFAAPTIYKYCPHCGAYMDNAEGR